MVIGENTTFSSNRSFLFKKSITEVSVNHSLLTIESNSFRLSIIRFYDKNDGYNEITTPKNL